MAACAGPPSPRRRRAIRLLEASLQILAVLRCRGATVLQCLLRCCSPAVPSPTVPQSSGPAVLEGRAALQAYGPTAALRHCYRGLLIINSIRATLLSPTVTVVANLSSRGSSSTASAADGGEVSRRAITR